MVPGPNTAAAIWASTVFGDASGGSPNWLGSAAVCTPLTNASTVIPMPMVTANAAR